MSCHLDSLVPKFVAGSVSSLMAGTEIVNPNHVEMLCDYIGGKEADGGS